MYIYICVCRYVCMYVFMYVRLVGAHPLLRVVHARALGPAHLFVVIVAFCLLVMFICCCYYRFYVMFIFVMSMLCLLALSCLCDVICHVY